MREKKNITIHDLAKEMNLAPSTISRALKDHPSIGKDTREAVKELAHTRGYRPNMMAANLRNQVSKTIGVVVSWIDRPFNASLISGIEEEARRHGYNAIISQTADRYDIEDEISTTLYDLRICGMIISLSMETRDYDHFQKFLRSETPIVFVDRVPGNINAQKVVIDNFTAGYKAVNHLIEHGCRRVAYIGGSLSRNIYEERFAGYREALAKNGIEENQTFQFHGKRLSYEEGRDFARLLLERELRPDGIFCANDTSAVAAIQVAKTLDIDIPGSLAIIGFNDDPICQIVDPSLSSITHPAHEMGAICVQKLLAQLEGKIDRYETVVLPTDLVVRSSTNRKIGV